jgi:hypothetical protein
MHFRDLPKFEEEYRRHAFAPLVGIALAVGECVVGLRRRRPRAPFGTPLVSKRRGPASLPFGSQRRGA